MNETRELVGFLSGLSFDKLPPEVIERAKLCVLDTVGVALYASQLPWSQIVAGLAKDSASVKESGVWTRGWRTSAQYAALCNAISAHGIEMDDRSASLSMHAGAVIIPTAIAAAAKTGANGRATVAAVVAGYEVAYRLSRALRRSRWHHFHATAIKSHFSAAATAARLLNLTESEMLNAFGIVGSMASGLQAFSEEPSGTMVKRLQGGGWPAHNGVMAALLAQKGFTGPSDILEADRGVCHAFARGSEPELGDLVKDLGSNYQIMQREIKPYAAWGGSHASIDAVKELTSAHQIPIEEIKGISIGCSLKAYETHGMKRPTSIMAAQYSTPFVVAVAFLGDLVDPSVWGEAILADRRALHLAEKVKMYVDEDIDRVSQATGNLAGVKMTIRMTSGQEYRTEVRHSRGTLENPSTPEELRQKFATLAGKVRSPRSVNKISRIIDTLEQVENVRTLDLALTRP